MIPASDGSLFSGEFATPSSGPGPVMRDPAHPRVSNDDYRARGAQPTFPMGDLNSPILQPWAREVLRKRNELVLSGKAAFPRQASCWPVGVPAFLGVCRAWSPVCPSGHSLTNLGLQKGGLLRWRHA